MTANWLPTHEFANIGAMQQTGQAFNCYGLITAAGECYSIAVGGQISDSPGKQKAFQAFGSNNLTTYGW